MPILDELRFGRGIQVKVRHNYIVYYAYYPLAALSTSASVFLTNPMFKPLKLSTCRNISFEWGHFRCYFAFVLCTAAISSIISHLPRNGTSYA